MSVNIFISARNCGISPDKSFFDKSLAIIGGNNVFEKLIYHTIICILRVSEAYSSLNCISLAISGVMVPFSPLVVKFLMR